MKIKKIEVQNFKAISEQVANFDGCSAIISAGNNKGKTSLLNGLIDRFRGLKPDIILKEGTEKGFNIIELTDGSRIEWKFTEKTESFAFITNEGIKMTTGVLSGIGEKYFGTKFDIDKFILSSGTQQSIMLAGLLGINLSEIDARYKIAYDKRTEANREYSRLSGLNYTNPAPVSLPDIDSLESELAKTKEANRILRQEWETENDKLRAEIDKFNSNQGALEQYLDVCRSEFESLKSFADTIFSDCIDYEKAVNKLAKIKRPEPKKGFTRLPEPEYKDVEIIESKIKAAYSQKSEYDTYQFKLNQFNNWEKQCENALLNAKECDEKVKAIQKEKEDLIKSSNIPTEFSFSDNGLLFNGLPINNQQLSTSARYIAALKLGALAIGKIKTLHFEASSLDRNSLKEIEKWAEKNDFQLLIERPDFEGGEIKYEII